MSLELEQNQMEASEQEAVNIRFAQEIAEIDDIPAEVQKEVEEKVSAKFANSNDSASKMEGS